MNTRAEKDRREWMVVESILDRALAVSSEQRAALLDRECGDDPELRRSVDALLESCDEDHGFLETPAGAFASSLVADEARADDRAEGTIIGAYRIIREIAKGGMGSVYLAERADGQFEQRVALKLIKRGMDSEEVHRRFLSERRILARLSHPHIARLLDGGMTPDGHPWFAMEFVDGLPITRYCNDRGASIADRIDLFQDVCEAVRYAHQNLVIHRDLKPSNILVTSEGHVELLDFGIAKLLEDESLDAPMTRTEVRVMTPEYAAPEQVRLEPITTATDVYALGAVLYELVTRKRVHQIKKHTPLEIQTVVCDVDPSPPHVSPDLDTIVMKALQKDPGRRYPSADALLDDLRRFRAGLPVRARPDTVGYRTRKFVRRHRIGVTAATAVVLSLIGGLTAFAWQAKVAKKEAARAGEVKTFLVSLFRSADPTQALGHELTAREMLGRGVQQLDTGLTSEPEIKAELYDVVGRIYYALTQYAQADSLFERSVELSRTIYGPSHSVVAERLTDWGSALQLRGEWDRAGPVLASALHILEQQHGKNHPLVAETLSEIGNLKRLQNRYDSAEAFYRRALDIQRGVRHPDSLRIAMDLGALANVLIGATKFNAADTALQDALAIERRLLPPNHPDIARSLRNLAVLRQSEGRLKEAEAIGRDALRRRRALFPPTAPAIGESAIQLGTTLELAGYFPEAESLYTEALEIRRQSLGVDAPETIATLNGLASVRLQTGSLTAAESAAREAQRLISVRGLPDRHPGALTNVDLRGLILSNQGKYTQAEVELRRALDGRRSAFGRDHLSVAASLRHLGMLLYRTGRYEEAEQLVGEGVEIYRRRLPPSHVNLATAETELATILVARKRPQAAEPLLRRALATEAHNLSVADPRVVETRRVLATTLSALGRRDEAVALLDSR